MNIRWVHCQNWGWTRTPCVGCASLECALTPEAAAAYRDRERDILARRAADRVNPAVATDPAGWDPEGALWPVASERLAGHVGLTFHGAPVRLDARVGPTGALAPETAEAIETLADVWLSRGSTDGEMARWRDVLEWLACVEQVAGASPILTALRTALVRRQRFPAVADGRHVMNDRAEWTLAEPKAVRS